MPSTSDVHASYPEVYCAINEENLVHPRRTHRRIAFLLALNFWRFEI